MHGKSVVMSVSALPGFYGKFPQLGDFVNRRLPRSFLDPWDDWLQGCIATSRQQLGDGWLNLYLTSPVWQFALSGGLCGEQPWCGILMPSVDRVGRYYPLVIATPLPLDVNLMQIVTEGRDWFSEAESVILGALDECEFDLDTFDQKVASLGDFDELASYSAASIHAGFGSEWRIPLGSEARVSGAIHGLVHQLILQRLGSYSLWWGAGSQDVQPSLLIASGLPEAPDFAALLSGDWKTSAWEEWPLTKAVSPDMDDEISGSLDS